MKKIGMILFIFLSVYFLGFYLIVFGIKSNIEYLRYATMKIDSAIYYPLIINSSENSVIRKLAVHRIKVICGNDSIVCKLN